LSALRGTLQLLGVGKPTDGPGLRRLTPRDVGRIVVMMANSLEDLLESILPPTVDTYVCHAIQDTIVPVAFRRLVAHQGSVFVCGGRGVWWDDGGCGGISCFLSPRCARMNPPSSRTLYSPGTVMSRSPGATQATRMTWDADVLIDLVNDDHGPFDWRAVASELDFPEADFSRAEVCACVCVGARPTARLPSVRVVVSLTVCEFIRLGVRDHPMHA
jgi:hypothetical protein